MELEKYSYDYLLETALSKIPETIDKRPGSIIYDALAPSCYNLAEFFMELYNSVLDTSIETAIGINLNNLVGNMGLIRYPSTKAIKKAIFINDSDERMEIPLNSRFSTIGNNPINYTVINYHYDAENKLEVGAYDLQCEEFGKVGNNYLGPLMPISFINNLKSASMTDTVTSARDEETDDELRKRYLEELNKKEFSGNTQAYKKFLKELEGIGYAQIYPVWNGPGTVKCSLLDFSFNPISTETINKIKNIVDPLDYETLGVGIAPIGHLVTIATGTKKLINLKTEIVLEVGYSLEQLKDLIKTSINNYLDTVRVNWDVWDSEYEYNLSVYISQINRAILSVSGVANVTNTKINDSFEDLKLTETSSIQEIPFLGEILYE